MCFETGSSIWRQAGLFLIRCRRRYVDDGEDMIFLFWGLIITMIVVAIAVIEIPLGNGKTLPGTPGVLVGFVVTAITFGLYAFLGSPDAVTADFSQSQHTRFEPTSASSGRSGESLGSVASLVDGLKERLEQDPNDASGWLLLARSYEHLSRHEEASPAYERARSLGKTDLEFEKLLPGAILPVQETVAQSGPAMRGRVELSPDAASRVNPDDTIFIFAKESASQRMPVAALRKPATDLPIEFVLTDTHVMVPGTHLADFETLVVTARVSRSGLATDAIDGMEVWSKPVSPIGGGEIDLLIKTGSQPGDYENE